MPTLWQRTLLAVIGVLSALWLTATAARLVIVYDLYQPGTALLRPLPAQWQLEHLRVATNLGMVAWGVYGLLLLTSILAVLSWRAHMREHGYTALVLLLVLATVTWQAWVAPIELKILAEFPSRWIAPPAERAPVIIALINRRFIERSPADFLSMLTALSIIAVLIAQPLRLQQPKH